MPFWLDDELLFRLNYGPASSQDIERVKTQSGKLKFFPLYPRNIITSNRATITLLDTPLAAKYVAALYPRSNESVSTSIIPAFGYNTASIKTYSLVWVENFVVYHVWNKYYSSSILGEETRPSMAAVVMDMLDMIYYFKSIDGSTRPKPLSEWLADFLASHSLQSLSRDKDFDQKWACEGYLADLFSIVACLPRDEYSTLGPPAELGWDPDVAATISGRISVGRSSTSLLSNSLPGPQVFSFPDMPPVEKEGFVSLEDLDASFIESGAFRFRLTNRIGQHLTVDSDNNIYLYKNAEKLTVRAAGDVDFTDHPLSLEIYDAPEPRTWHNFFSSRDSSTRDKVRVLEAMGFIASLGLLASIVQIGLGVAQLRVAYRQLDQAP